MADDQLITVVGNLTADPELRFTPSGAAVANFTIAKTPRVFDKQSNEWVDQETLFFRCSAWREQAENLAETCKKGYRVIAEGRLKARSYEAKDGNRQTVWELDCNDVGPSMKYLSGKLNKTAKGGGGSFGGGGGFGGHSGGGAPAPAGFGGGGGGFSGGQGGPSPRQADVWSGQGGNDSGNWQATGDDEPPF